MKYKAERIKEILFYFKKTYMLEKSENAELGSEIVFDCLCPHLNKITFKNNRLEAWHKIKSERTKKNKHSKINWFFT